MPIEPAELAFDDSGTPYSTRYGDVYHSAESGPGQSRHVFLAGNDLPNRWSHAPVFTILETGFGIGLNFLSTWQAWRDDPARAQRLHFVSIEKHPFSTDALEQIHSRYAELEPLAHELRSAWPLLVAGLHRLHFDDERVTLTLAFGDVGEILPKLGCVADAVYLDGFAPPRNGDMWALPVIKALAKLCHRGTTLATYSSAANVRETLAAAGFHVEKRPGFGRKREMLAGSYEPRGAVSARAVVAAEKHAIIIGAGLAGGALCERLAARGWRIDLIEAKPASSGPAADRFAGAFHPHVSGDDALRSRATRSGFLCAVSRWLELERRGYTLAWDRCGLVQVAADREQERRFAKASEALAYPDEYARYVSRTQAQEIAACGLRAGGWWFPGSGWMQPARLAAAQIASAGEAVRAHFGHAVEGIRERAGQWAAIGVDGAVIAAAPVLILANSADAQRLANVGESLARVRGQVTYVPAERTPAPRTVITGRGYVLPAVDGVVLAGSTYDAGDDDPLPRVTSHEMNVAHLRRLLPDAPEDLDPASLDGAVGFRCTAPDRMPLVGAVPDIDRVHADRTQLAGARMRTLPRRNGLYCVTAFASRGLVWASIAAELLASRLDGDPLPVETDIADALDPARFVLRRLRRGRLEC